MKTQNEFVEIVEARKVLVTKYRLKGLRRLVAIALATSGEHNEEAARRAGISVWQWSRIINAPKIPETDLAIIAKGINRTPESIRQELSKKK
jgi:hypothetical protein